MRGAKWIDVDRYELVNGAQRFEDWEFPHALVLGLGAAARYAGRVGVGPGGRRAATLAATLRRELAEVDGLRVLDRGRQQCAIVTVDVSGWDASDLVSALGQRGINTTASLRWYGLIDFTKKGTTSALRLSPHYYNTEEEITSAVGALRKTVGSDRR
jgi:selenocysteine lyase/cysteine desulfurase